MGERGRCGAGSPFLLPSRLREGPGEGAHPRLVCAVPRSCTPARQAIHTSPFRCPDPRETDARPAYWGLRFDDGNAIGKSNGRPPDRQRRQSRIATGPGNGAARAATAGNPAIRDAPGPRESAVFRACPPSCCTFATVVEHSGGGVASKVANRPAMLYPEAGSGHQPVSRSCCAVAVVT